MAIRSVGSTQFIATFITDDGREKDYSFTESRGPIRAIQACEQFGEDVGPFGYSHLVYKAVSAFRYAYQKPVGCLDRDDSGSSQEEHPDTTSSLPRRPQAGRRLVAIRAADQNHYAATFTNEEGHETDYDFRVNSGNDPTTEESPKFREDIEPFNNSLLVRKAVIAFHDSHEKLVGRPDGYEAPLPQDDPGRAD